MTRLNAREMARVFREASRRMPDQRSLTREQHRALIAEVAAELYPGKTV